VREDALCQAEDLVVGSQYCLRECGVEVAGVLCT
jgi:hypothetical protein